jgi:hypothetical protein
MPTINGEYVEYPEGHAHIKPYGWRRWEGPWVCQCGFYLGPRDWAITKRFHNHLLTVSSEAERV